MRTDGIFLAGIGSQIPPVMPAAVAAAQGRYDTEALERDGWTGAAVAGEIPAPDLAVEAARRAIAAAGADAACFSLVLHATVWHQGPEMWLASHYVERHTISGTAPAIEIRQGCNGFLAAMDLAAGHLARDARGMVLITGADNFGTPLLDRWRYAKGTPSNRGSILGDAGSAMVLTRRRGFARLLAVGLRSLPELEELHRGATALFPPECTEGRPADPGARLAGYARKNPLDFDAAKTQLNLERTALALDTLEEADVKPTDITRATHVFSGGREYVRSVLEPIGIDPDRGMLDFGRRVGHLGLNDHVAGLDHLLATGAVGRGDHVLMLGNAPGIALGCAVIEILDTMPRSS